MTIQQKRNIFMVLSGFLVALALAGCSIRTSENHNGSNKSEDVDIRSPFGSVSVHEGSTDAKDLGLPAYPGARPTKGHGDNDENGNANVNLSSPFFGLKVVVRSFETDDSPSKVLDFYQKPMGKYGKVLLCNSGSGENYGNFHHHGRHSPVSCEDNNRSGDEKQLKVGTEDDQHVVAVKPRGKGTEFTLVYVRAKVEDDNKDTI